MKTDDRFPQVFPVKVGIDLRGSDAGMSEQDLDDADVHASLKQVRGKAVPKRVRSELVVEAALASRFIERVACGSIGQVAHDSATGE